MPSSDAATSPRSEMASPAGRGMTRVRVERPGRRFRAVRTLLVCALAVSGCAGEEAPDTPPSRLDTLAGGCLDLEIGAWGPSPLGADSIFLGVPQRIVLDSVPDWRATSRWRPVQSVPGTTPSIYPRGQWRRNDQSELELAWIMEDAGVVVRLVDDGRSLRGRAEYFQPERSPSPAAPAVAHAVDCAAAVPAEWADYRRFPLRVGLVSGDTLAVGSPLPEGIDVSRGEYGTAVVRGRAAGIFADGTDLVVALSRAGVVRSVRLSYPTAELVPLIERFSSAWGPPTSDHRDTGLGSVRWVGRDSEVDVRTTSTREGADLVQVHLSRGLYDYWR